MLLSFGGKGIIFGMPLRRLSTPDWKEIDWSFVWGWQFPSSRSCCTSTRMNNFASPFGLTTQRSKDYSRIDSQPPCFPNSHIPKAKQSSTTKANPSKSQPSYDPKSTLSYPSCNLIIILLIYVLVTGDASRAAFHHEQRIQAQSSLLRHRQAKPPRASAVGLAKDAQQHQRNHRITGL